MSNWSNITLSPTISLGSLSSGSGQTFNIIEGLTGSEYYKVKKFEMYESPEDLLALSVTWKRLRDTNKSHASKLLDKFLFDNVTSDDKVKANEIRDYYSKKIMMWKLKSTKPFTKFREDMNRFVHSDGLTFRDDVFGMVYHLPMFYDYDKELDSVKSEVVVDQKFKQLDAEHKPKVLTLTPELVPIKKVEKRRKRVFTTEYWLRDTKQDAGVVITLDAKNPLEHIWEHLFNTEKVLQIKGQYCRRNMDEFEYFSVDKWTLHQA